MNEAAIETGELAWLQNIYETAGIAAEKALKSVVALQLELCLSKLYFMYQSDEKKAVKIWRKLAKLPLSSRPHLDVTYARETDLDNFAVNTFDKAMQAGIGTPEADFCMKRLKELAIANPQAGAASSRTFNVSFGSTVLGMWYRLNGRLEEAQGCFRPFIKKAIDILSNNDPRNDGERYIGLLDVLLKAGEDNNANALYSIRLDNYAIEKESGKSDLESATGKRGKGRYQICTKPESWIT